MVERALPFVKGKGIKVITPGFQAETPPPDPESALGHHSMPEIYTSYPTHAGQWQKISLWAALNKGDPIPFAGALANWDASGYNSNNYTPAQSWQVFYDKLGSDSRTYIHGLGWSSDMTYGN